MTTQQFGKRQLILVVALFLGISTQPSQAQVTTQVVWQRCIGGIGTDWASRLTGTSDGGFICVGWSASNDGDAVGSHGGNDILVAKLDANGAMLWRRSLGGSSEDYGYSGIEASDGSIMIMGQTFSTDGDVTANHGGEDLWVVKLSPLGTTIWEHCYGGSGFDNAVLIQETADGGFVLHGNTSSPDGDVSGYHTGSGQQDCWVLKISSSGVLEWNRALGGSDIDVNGSLIQTADGGYLMYSTYTKSNDGDVLNYHGDGDCWLVKLSAAGAIEWSRTVGGSQQEFGDAVYELANGDLMFLGSTLSSDGDISLNHGSYDVLLVRISSSGVLLWERTYGGSLGDDCRSLLPTTDGGSVMAGSSASSDGDLTGNQGDNDVWVLKVDASGAFEWQRSYGGSLDDWAYLYEGENDGYLLSGITNSNDGTIEGSHGDRELWFAKLDDNGDLVWQRCLGGANEDWGYFMTRTADGGYVASGYTDSNDGDVSGNHGQRDMWVVKLKVTEPTEPLECALYIPNAFSPDNSTKNDSQCLYGTDCIERMTFNIFDRWGNKVFESTNPKACWDGTYNGQALDPAVFVYHLSATMINGETVERQGNITLVR